MGNHEWCFYGWKEGAAHFFNPSITNSADVWIVKKVTPASMMHLTEKPVGTFLFRMFVNNIGQGFACPNPVE